jgi:hypothetical protein
MSLLSESAILNYIVCTDDTTVAMVPPSLHHAVHQATSTLTLFCHVTFATR